MTHLERYIAAFHQMDERRRVEALYFAELQAKTFPVKPIIPQLRLIAGHAGK